MNANHTSHASHAGRRWFRDVSPRILAAAGLCAAAVMLPGYTFYEIETDVGPIPLRWYIDAVDVFHDSSLTPDAPSDGVLDAINASLAAWDDVACEHPALVNAGPVTDGAAFKIDDDTNSRHGTNIIIFEDEAAWDANHGDSELDMSMTVALTTIFHVASTGKIMNFALEMNDPAFKFGIAPTGYAFDIQNTITHELGHVMGLDHTDSGATDWTQQTMYFQTEPAETLKRTLGDDDRAGFCELYSTDWKADLPDPDVGCSAAGLGGGNASSRSALPGPVLPMAATILLLALASAVMRHRIVRGRGRPATVTEHQRGLPK